jgi:D-alanyl-D-alanine carboxypeptidase
MGSIEPTSDERRVSIHRQSTTGQTLCENLVLEGTRGPAGFSKAVRMRIRASVLGSILSFLLPIASAIAGPALLVEPATGLVLYAEDADVPWRPASLTKLMTAYLAFEAIRDGKLSPEDVLICSKQAASQPPSKLGLPVGGQLKVDLAIKVLIIRSANDVAIMLGDKIAGDQAAFVELMNQTAKRLGMTNTNFVNPNGLPMLNPDGTEASAQSVTSARDMALLASMILNEFPQYAEIFSMHEVKVGNRLVSHHNGLLQSYEWADGMKTGFICAAGYNVVGSATRDGRKLVAVVLGENSAGARTIRAAGLFEHGFEIYPWKAVLATTLATWPVETSANATPPDLHSVVCNGHAPKLKRKAKRPALKPGHRQPGTKPKQPRAKTKKRTDAAATPATVPAPASHG